MITDIHELQDQLEKLRKNTLSIVWQEIEPSISNNMLKDLENILMAIKRSDDRKLKQDAVKIIKSIVDIDVDCEPSVEISF
jgi:hypothetical protein